MKALAALLLLLVLPGLSATAAEPVRVRAPLRVAVTESTFRNLNREDAIASFRVFMQVTGRKHGFELDPDVQVFKDYPALRAATATGGCEIVWIDAWEAARIKTDERLQPAFLTCWQSNRVDRKYLLLARRDSGLTDIGSVRGRSIAECPVIATDMGHRWLRATLLTNGIPDPERFFGRIETVAKPSAAVLPVFFGKRDACVIDEASYSVLCELNPQLGGALTILAASPPLPSSCVCLATSGWPVAGLDRAVRLAMTELHEDPAGRQILMLFKGSRLMPVTPERFTQIEALRAVLEPREAGP